MCLKLARDAPGFRNNTLDSSNDKYGMTMQGETGNNCDRHEQIVNATGVGTIHDGIEIPSHATSSYNATGKNKTLMADSITTTPDTSRIPPAIRRIISERETCCQRLEDLCLRCDLEAKVEFENICRKWQIIASAPEEYQELLDKRFEQAGENFRNRLEQLKKQASERAERVDKLEWLCVESARLCSVESTVPSRKKMRQMRNDWNRLSQHTADIDVLQKKFDDNLLRLEERVSAREESRKQALGEIEKACEELAQIMTRPNPDEFRKRKSELDANVEKALSLLEDDYAASEPKQNYQRLNRKFADYLHQLYQVRDLARWEHYTRKLDLCAQLDKLLETDDNNLPAAAKKLKFLRTAWQNIGSVPHEKSEEIWLRFKSGCDHLQQRVSTYFDALAARREQIAQEKVRLCEEAESHQHRNDWEEGAAIFKKLQQRWHEIGFAHPEQEKLLYHRFRTACDFFFNTRKDHHQEIKKSQAESAAVKHMLCDEAEKLLELPYGDAHRRIPSLWQRWKEAGSAGKDDQQLYGRFRKSFDRYYDSLRNQRQENLEIKRNLLTELEKLQSTVDTGNLESINHEYHRLLAQWRDAGPIPYANEAEIMEKYRLLTNAINEHFDHAGREKKKLQLSRHLQIERIMSQALTALLADNHAALSAAKESWNELTMPEKADAEHEFSRICRLSAQTDSGAINQLASQAEKNLQQRKIICLEFEKIAGTSPEKNDNKTLSPQELAEELRLAITSNFAARRDTQRPSDKEIGNMIKRWFANGVVPLGELDSLYERFGRALEQLDIYTL